MADFIVGDTVVLKSGSPVMTIELVEEKTVRCIWFEGKEIKRGAFFKDTIVKEDISEEE